MAKTYNELLELVLESLNPSISGGSSSSSSGSGFSDARKAITGASSKAADLWKSTKAGASSASSQPPKPAKPMTPTAPPKPNFNDKFGGVASSIASKIMNAKSNASSEVGRKAYDPSGAKVTNGLNDVGAKVGKAFNFDQKKAMASNIGKSILSGSAGKVTWDSSGKAVRS